MKDPKNIRLLNKLTLHYISLRGLRGETLQTGSPFMIYFTNLLALLYTQKGEISFDKLLSNITDKDIETTLEEKLEDSGAKFVVGNSLFHAMIQEAYQLYEQSNEVEISPIVGAFIGATFGDFDVDEFITKSVDDFKDTLTSLLSNFKSKNETYNRIKQQVLQDTLSRMVDSEDYEEAAVIKEKLDATNELIKESLMKPEDKKEDDN